MKRIYLGCDLFIESERLFAKSLERRIHEAVKDRLQEKVLIYNPANNLDINDKSQFAHGYDILMADYNRLKESDILIALLDTEDIGLAVEIGIAFERNIPVLQLHTDIRLQGSDNEVKHAEMAKDPLQNDIKYINKLLTNISYGDKYGNMYDRPNAYLNTDDLIDGLIEELKRVDMK